MQAGLRSSRLRLEHFTPHRKPTASDTTALRSGPTSCLTSLSFHGKPKSPNEFTAHSASAVLVFSRRRTAHVHPASTPAAPLPPGSGVPRRRRPSCGRRRAQASGDGSACGRGGSATSRVFASDRATGS